MTNEEALIYASDTCFCAGCDVNRRPNDSCDDCEHRQFFELVKRLIRKQIPKKPESQHHCPCCGLGLDIPELTLPKARKYINFYPKLCPDCGQAIDWSK